MGESMATSVRGGSAGVQHQGDEHVFQAGVHAIDGDGTTGELSLEVELERNSSAWLAVRTSGGSRQAHSAPVYLVVDGQERCWKREAVPTIVEEIQRVLARIPTQEIDWSTQHEKDAVDRSHLLRAWEAQKEAVAERVSEASRVYESLVEGGRIGAGRRTHPQH